MPHLDGKSILTSTGVLLLYYACIILAFGVFPTIFVAIIGTLISRSAAKKEGAPLVIRHCTWIFRSIYLTFFLFLLLGFVIFVSLGGAFTNLPDTSHITTFSELWNDPTLKQAIQYTSVIVLCAIFIICWTAYRVLRGVGMLFYSKAP